MFRFFFDNPAAPVNRLPWVDYAKGLAIILVVYRHVLIGLYKAGIEVDQTYVIANQMVYNFRMPLFFLIGGFLIRKSINRRSTVQFLYTKFDTILYPYLLWSFLQVTLQILFSDFAHATRSFSHYLYIFYQPRAIDQFWYLYALFNVSILYLVLYKFCRGSNIALLAIALPMHYFASYFKEVSLVHDLMHYFLFLVIGDCLSRFVLEERNAKLISSTRLTALIMPIFIFCQWLWLNHDLNIFTHFIIALVGCTLMVNLCFKLQSSKSFFWLRYVGFYSLYIYVMHVIIGAGVRVLLISVLGLSNPTIIFILATFCAVIIPIMLYNAAIKFGLWFLFNLGKPKRLAVSSSL